MTTLGQFIATTSTADLKGIIVTLDILIAYEDRPRPPSRALMFEFVGDNWSFHDEKKIN